eukprot:TRINITY_DN8266_c0_g1_i11.p2 TRINITY_DN8266_c0_g1~~TRINITY_DN8266_c0_g1_i11.p2  ORF type:complete len:162 (+),score=26.02 TRINITY_DN8266_c0_g1_i11:456-941(+)
MLDTMCMALGGRVAEMIIFNTISTGARDDLERITNLAYSQVSLYGMNDRVGPLSFPNKGESMRPYSDDLAETMDEEVRALVKGALERTRGILNQHRDGLEGVAQLLLEKEVIFGEDLERILGPRPFPVPREAPLGPQESGPPPPPQPGEIPSPHADVPGLA